MSQEEKRILIIGGTGFIGQQIVKHALKLGWIVTCLSLNPNKCIINLDVNYIVADITDKDSLKCLIGDTEFNYVVNCGGYIDHSLFFNGGRKIFDTHFQGVLNLIEALNQDALLSFVNIGSSDEYGNVAAPQSEIQREAPISPYSLGKVASTHFLQMLYRTEGFPATTLRLFLVYGPGQDNGRFLPQVIRGCLEGRSFPTSNGEQLRDFCFVQDVVDAIFLTFDNLEVKGEVINIASGLSISVRSVIETINRLVGKGDPRFGEIAYRPGENMELFADISKAKQLLHWKPKINLQDGLCQTIDHFRGIVL